MANGKIEQPPILERLRDTLGSYCKVAKALGVSDSYPVRWKREGFIPETYALDIDELGIRDSWGDISAMHVLHEAAHARRRRYEQSMQEEGV